MRLPIFALAVLALGLPLAAHAVDLPPAPILDDDEEALGSGWYLRGDVGGLDQMVSRRSRDRGLDGLSSLVNGKLDRAAIVGAGIGYQFSPWFRTDVTIDHRFEAAFRGARIGGSGAYALDRADFDATTFLVNAYVDLPFWNGITPYLGVGIGASRARFDGYESSVVGPSGAIDMLGFFGAQRNASRLGLDGRRRVRPHRQFKIDLGYRYSRLDGGDFDRSTAPVRPRNIGAHEFRVGARYLFD